MDKKIIHKIKSQKDYLYKNFDISKIGIFGSYAKDDFSLHSEIDILVEFNNTPSLFKFFKLEEYLESLLEKKIDLVREQGLKPRIKDQILSEVIYI